MDIRIKKQNGLEAVFKAPPSKSFTHRALIIAALAEGTSVIHNVLVSDDTIATAEALAALGIKISPLKEGIDVTVNGCAGVMEGKNPVTINCRGSGTTMRSILPTALLYPKPVTVGGNPRLNSRPAGPLCMAMAELGASVEYRDKRGYPPVKVSGNCYGGICAVDASQSSQFITGLLIAAPYAQSPVEILPKGKVASRPYIEMTIEVMHDFGIETDFTEARTWRVNQGIYQARDYTIEGDYSSSSYFFAMAAAAGGSVTVTGLNPASLQGDAVLIDALSDMGCTITKNHDSITVSRTGRLHGITICLSDAPDIVQTLAAAALFACSPTEITGIENLRIKESDRIEAVRILTENAGGSFEYSDDNSGTIVIIPPPNGKIHGFECSPNNDHRTAMAAAVIGTGTDGVVIHDAECADKSFPEFWNIIREAGLSE